MKKTLLALTTALVLPATAALADGPTIQAYAGVQAGGTFSHTDFKTNSHNNLAPDSFRDQQIKDRTDNTFATGGVFAGLRLFFGAFFTGFEVEGNWDGMNIKANAPHKNTGVTWRIELKRRSQIIPSATIGWKCSEKTAFYAKFGAGFSKFDLNIDRGDDNTNTRSHTIVHFVPALGAEYELHKNVALRAEVSGEVAGRHIKGSSEATPDIYQRTTARYRSVSVKAGIFVKV